jgi:hypothetical protein
VGAGGGNIVKYTARVSMYIFADADSPEEAQDIIFEEIENSELDIDGDITVGEPMEA